MPSIFCLLWTEQKANVSVDWFIIYLFSLIRSSEVTSLVRIQMEGKVQKKVFETGNQDSSLKRLKTSGTEVVFD